jgi:hypothetical protein
MARRTGPDSESEAAEAEGGEPLEGLRWEVGRSWTLPSPQDVERRFDELIRERWGRSGGGSWLAVQREVWVELELPGLEKREIRARLEVRSEAGGWRVRIRQSERRDAAVEGEEK